MRDEIDLTKGITGTASSTMPLTKEQWKRLTEYHPYRGPDYVLSPQRFAALVRAGVIDQDGYFTEGHGPGDLQR